VAAARRKEEGGRMKDEGGRRKEEGEMGGGERPVANPVAVLREEFDDWAVLFNPDTADAVGINPVGVAVWKMMDGRRDVATIVAGVEEAFAEVPEAAGAEVRAFIDDLAARGFVGYEVKEEG
jgi:SynChlorMet cassette protein ScmD